MSRIIACLGLFCALLVAGCDSHGSFGQWDERIVGDGGPLPSGDCTPETQMPTTISPATPYLVPSSLTTPADTDPGNAASVNGAFQAIETGMWALSQVQVLGARISYYSTDGANIVISGPGAVPVNIGGVQYQTITLLGGTINAATVLGTALSSNTWYYIYAGIVAGSPAYTVSTTGPVNNYASGSSNALRFVGLFLTDGSANIVPFVCNAGHYDYVNWAAGNAPTLGLSKTATGFGTFSPTAYPTIAMALKMGTVVVGENSGYVGLTTGGTGQVAGCAGIDGNSTCTSTGIAPVETMSWVVGTWTSGSIKFCTAGFEY